MKSALIVAREATAAQTLSVLRAIAPDCEIFSSSSMDEAISLSRSPGAPPSFSLVLIDDRLDDIPTVLAVRQAKLAFAEAEVVLLAEDPDITLDIELMKSGAYGTLQLPARAEAVRNLVESVREKKAIAEENRAFVQVLEEFKLQTIISHSPEIEKVLSMAARAAASAATVLIRGESGTGKELIARAIHLLSPRKNRSFVPVNIAALSENLIESELFGHVKGSFTGAVQDRIGRFELADKGTLFIDEIGDVPPGIQVKLLRALQFASFERVGDNATKEVDVRIIAATNRNLEHDIKEGRFRADLFYRVNVVPITISPLREHRGDIPYLVEHFLKRYSLKNRKQPKGITAEAMAKLMRYPYPGNVRELENVIERGVVLCRGEYLTETDILLPAIQADEAGDRNSRQNVAEGTPIAYEAAMHAFETSILEAALTRAQGNRSAAARELGITERRLRNRLQILQLDKTGE